MSLIDNELKELANKAVKTGTSAMRLQIVPADLTPISHDKLAELSKALNDKVSELGIILPAEITVKCYNLKDEEQRKSVLKDKLTIW